jgi:hypothetical protein
MIRARTVFVLVALMATSSFAFAFALGTAARYAAHATSGGTPPPVPGSADARAALMRTAP